MTAMRLFRSRHMPMVLSLALFGLLVYWTNTPKRPSNDLWLAEYNASSQRFVLDFSADLHIDALDYDHIVVNDTLNHHLQRLALAFPEIRQDARLDACCPGTDAGQTSYHAQLRLRFVSPQERSAFLSALQAFGGLRLHDRKSSAAGFNGHASLDLDIPGRDARLRMHGIAFQVQHSELLDNV
jgi:hypothetical protein